MKKITNKNTYGDKTTIIKEGNITSEIFKFDTSWWMIDYYVDGEFDPGLRGKFHTKKECVQHFDTVKKIVAQWDAE